MEIAGTDVEAFRYAISNSSGLRGYELYQQQKNAPARTRAPFVVLLTGASGAGKTSTAVRLSEHVHGRYFMLNQIGGSRNEPWFDGYDGSAPIVVDEFRGQYELGSFLRLIDRYSYRGEVKGGFVNVAADVIVVTSNQSPDEWYPGQDPIPLLRRVNVWVEYHQRLDQDKTDNLRSHMVDLLIEAMESRESLDNSRLDPLMAAFDDVSGSITVRLYEDGHLFRLMQPSLLGRRVTPDERVDMTVVPIREVRRR